MYDGAGTPLWLSLGENCAAAVKLRAVMGQPYGSSFFNNVVAPLRAVWLLLETDFDCLHREHMYVAEWEGVDCVFDWMTGLGFHHSFYTPGKERLNAEGRRIILPEDIDAYLPAVRSQYAHLADKFRRQVRSGAPKVFAMRKISGSPLNAFEWVRTRTALRTFGARNFHLAPVHSTGRPGGFSEQHRIEEHRERWGANEEWSALVDRINQGHAVNIAPD